jgi:hypothetical protein
VGEQRKATVVAKELQKRILGLHGEFLTVDPVTEATAVDYDGMKKSMSTRPPRAGRHH